MKVGDFEIEVQTQRYSGGWMAVAYLPDGRQVASAPWDTAEKAEHDVYEQALMRLMPAPKFDPSRKYETEITRRRANGLLEHCGHCPDDKPGDVTKAKCPACGGPGVLEDRDGQVHFHCRDCGASFSEKRGIMSETADEPGGGQEPKIRIRLGGSHEKLRRQLAKLDAAGVAWKDLGVTSLHAHASNHLFEVPNTPEIIQLIRQIGGSIPNRPNKSLPPPKSSFYPSDGGSGGGGGGITSV